MTTPKTLAPCDHDECGLTECRLATEELLSVDQRRLVRLPVSAVKMPFGSWMWFLADADGKNIAQIMPSGDEATCRELARLINLGASICEPNVNVMARPDSSPNT